MIQRAIFEMGIGPSETRSKGPSQEVLDLWPQIFTELDSKVPPWGLGSLDLPSKGPELLAPHTFRRNRMAGLNFRLRFNTTYNIWKIW